MSASLDGFVAQLGFDMDVGGPTTASTLMRLGLIETRTFGSGVVYLRYEVASPAGRAAYAASGRRNVSR
jgi:hypothetical protein